MSKYNNLFVYQGSKVSMLTYLIKDDILPKKGRILVEPFMGSCSLLLNTDYEKYYFNDINKEIYDFTNILLSVNLDDLNNSYNCLVENFYYKGNDKSTINKKKDFYYKCRDFYFSKYNEINDLKKAALFCFLTYNSFGGRNISKIISCGHVSRKLKLRLDIYKKFQEKADKIKIYNKDYNEFILEVLKNEKEEEINLYFDPPYVDSIKYQKDNNLNDFVTNIEIYFKNYNFNKTIKSNFKNELVMDTFRNYKIIEIDRRLEMQSKQERIKTELIIIK